MHGQIRLLPVAAALILLASCSSSGDSAAASPDRFSRVPATAVAGPASAARAASFRPVVVPLGLSDAPTTVVLELAGDPVAVASASAVAPLTRAEKRAMKEQLRAGQAPVESAVRAQGGTVLASYQHAYNGVKVRIAASKARELANIPGVVAVRPVRVFKPDNVNGVPLIGAPQAWAGVPGLRGEGIKIAIIDTGIDYTHADFGGPGTVAAFDAAFATNTLPADPALFGPAAAKVKGGIDLVGDDYDAGDPTSVPQPDPNPLDCNGHGSHVSGTAAGFGVLSVPGGGATYAGPYDAATIGSNSWLVGPGVAPKADLYAVRVFGCTGSTNVVVDAIDWAVENEMDVINMSLGSPFGSGDDPDAVAASNAAKAGVIVVASAGNNGPSPYITGAPASGSDGISVAASDPTQSFPGARLAFSTGTTLTAIDANGATFADGLTAPVLVLKDANGAISLGCDRKAYGPAGAAGKIVVTARGVCARVARAIFGEQAGAVAVIMLNNAAAFPPFEGPITSNPDDGEPFNVTIPFLGVPLSDANRTALLAADGGTVTLTNATLANPGFRRIASFSSGGPRTGDSALKPEVTAPGVSIFSVGIGTGIAPAALSGTSMAAPHTAGAAALVRQAHPDWKRVRDWKAALVNTADPAGVSGFTTRSAGGGLVQVQKAAATQTVAVTNGGAPVLDFGFAELDRDFTASSEIKVRNLGTTAATFDVATSLAAGSPHSLAVRSSRVTVKPKQEVGVKVELSVPAATAGDSRKFADVSGVVTFTPVGGSNGGAALRVPYYFVPQSVSHVFTELDVKPFRKAGGAATATGIATVTNRRGAVSGNADWYAWGLSGTKDNALRSSDLRAAGVQTFPLDGVLAFGISTFNRWSNAAMNEFDVSVDVDGDGLRDYTVVAADLGALTTGTFDGRMAVAVFTEATGDGTIAFLADAPMDSTSIVLPVLFEQLCTPPPTPAPGAPPPPPIPCLSATSPRLSYWVQSFGLTDGTTDALGSAAAPARFNAFAPAISNGMFDAVAPGGSATESVTVTFAEFARTPALGVMVVSHDNPSVADGGETQLIEVRVR